MHGESGGGNGESGCLLSSLSYILVHMAHAHTQKSEKHRVVVIGLNTRLLLCLFWFVCVQIWEHTLVMLNQCYVCDDYATGKLSSVDT